MIIEIKNKEKTYHMCEVCGFSYKEKICAEKCEDYCTKHNACSIEITSHAIQIK